MRIWKLMTRDVWTCRLDDNLDAAAREMWDHDIGALPVIDEHGRIAGVVTDRDICMATYTRGEPPKAIAVRDTMSPHIATCQADSDHGDVEALMRRLQISRIPVVDDMGRLVGIVTLRDLARAIEHHTDVEADEVAATLAAISAPRKTLVEAA